MDVLLLLVCVVLLGAAVFLYLDARRRQRSESGVGDHTASDPLRRSSAGGIDPRRLKVGDVVRLDGRDFLVRGSLAFDEDGYRWQEHLLDDASIKRWLSVEDDEELEIVLWEAIKAPGLAPGPDVVDHDGVRYEFEERGRAEYKATGATGTGPSGTVEYADYAAGDRRLSFERYGGETWEVGVGRVVSERALDIYPSAPGA